MKDVQFNDNSNDKSGVKGFKVTTKIQGNPSDDVRLRVIVYGPNTLNKPTLDKSGLLIHLNDHGTLRKHLHSLHGKYQRAQRLRLV